jgi:putative Ca2+/H+ antiporter (TMEM165/GDT1 family)
LGTWITRLVDPVWMRWILGLSFLAVAAWMLVPDQADDVEGAEQPRFGVFGVTVIAFFLAEMGDKTQIATVAMAAHYSAPVMVVIGTTLGMLIADVPAVFAGDKLAHKIPMKLVHSIAAAVFALLGVAALLGAGSKLGF